MLPSGLVALFCRSPFALLQVALRLPTPGTGQRRAKLGRFPLFNAVCFVHVDGARLVPFRRAALAGRSVVLFVSVVDLLLRGVTLRHV